MYTKYFILLRNYMDSSHMQNKIQIFPFLNTYEARKNVLLPLQ